MKQAGHVKKMQKKRNAPRKLAIMKDVLPNSLIIFGIMFLVLAYGPVVSDEIWYQFKELRNIKFTLNSNDGTNDSIFSRYLASDINLVPVNEDFSIVIEKIGVNAPIVADVSVTDEDSYLKSLKSGVAHAATAPYPSEDPGNVYLFAHSAVNFWELGKYAKVFNLLRKTELGDTVHIFHKGKDYTYEIINKEIYEGWNTYPITRPVIEPILTLQTCDPPGTTKNRLVVTAKLINVE